MGIVGGGIGKLRTQKGISKYHQQNAPLSPRLPQRHDTGDTRLPKISETVISKSRRPNESTSCCCNVKYGTANKSTNRGKGSVWIFGYKEK
mmetsp:Transcript_10600/g.12195  ORF Transcript_10600/g.12195 Transcript_10600/m.12195 type:complete len:91 (+) Transcript_10600:953-1225(+)